MIVLCDIEGTTTDIAFVKDVLFPYARDNCKDFLMAHFEEPEIQEIINDLVELSIKDGKPIEKSEDKTAFVDSIVANVHQQISEDRKTKELKALQGKIWKVGYENGSIKGHVYDDVPTAFEMWQRMTGHVIYIYSSGSVEAQKLLFKYSVKGNLLSYIWGHFDTNIGHKQEAQSYKNIVKEIQKVLKIEADDVFFLTDIPNEAIAAKEAGMRPIILDRPNNPTMLSADIKRQFKVVTSFVDIYDIAEWGGEDHEPMERIGPNGPGIFYNGSLELSLTFKDLGIDSDDLSSDSDGYCLASGDEWDLSISDCSF